MNGGTARGSPTVSSPTPRPSKLASSRWPTRTTASPTTMPPAPRRHWPSSRLPPGRSSTLISLDWRSGSSPTIWLPEPLRSGRVLLGLGSWLQSFEASRQDENDPLGHQSHPDRGGEHRRRPQTGLGECELAGHEQPAEYGDGDESGNGD